MELVAVRLNNATVILLRNLKNDILSRDIVDVSINLARESLLSFVNVDTFIMRHVAEIFFDKNVKATNNELYKIFEMVKMLSLQIRNQLPKDVGNSLFYIEDFDLYTGVILLRRENGNR